MLQTGSSAITGSVVYYFYTKFICNFFVTFPQILKRVTEINLIVNFFIVIPLQSGYSVINNTFGN